MYRVLVICLKTKFQSVKIAYLIPALMNKSINITSDPVRVGRLLGYKKFSDVL